MTGSGSGARRRSKPTSRGSNTVVDDVAHDAGLPITAEEFEQLTLAQRLLAIEGQDIDHEVAHLDGRRSIADITRLLGASAFHDEAYLDGLGRDFDPDEFFASTKTRIR